MFKRKLILASAFCALSIPAHAAPVLVYVSGKGADAAGCGAITAPCRTMQIAHDRVEAGGYIVALDPADFGKVFIRKSINIANESGGAALLRAPAPYNCGLAVKAGPTEVARLRGLTIEGNGPTTWGACFNEGKRIEISDSVIRNAGNSGVFFSWASNGTFVISDTTIEDNGVVGLSGSIWSGYAKGLRLVNNSAGGTDLSSPASSWFGAPVVLADSLIANDPGRSRANYCYGLSGYPLLILRNSTVRGFPVGVGSQNFVRLSRSIITGNAKALEARIVETAGDNVFRDNVDDTLGWLTPVQNR